MTIKIKDLKYEDKFYWKGNKYTQVIRPKRPTRKSFVVVCRRSNWPCMEWVDMPAGRIVKPVIRC